MFKLKPPLPSHGSCKRVLFSEQLNPPGYGKAKPWGYYLSCLFLQYMFPLKVSESIVLPVENIGKVFIHIPFMNVFEGIPKINTVRCIRQQAVFKFYTDGFKVEWNRRITLLHRWYDHVILHFLQINVFVEWKVDLYSLSHWYCSWVDSFFTSLEGYR